VILSKFRNSPAYSKFAVIINIYLNGYKDNFDQLKKQLPRNLAFGMKLLTGVHEKILETSSQAICLTDVRRGRDGYVIDAVTHAFTDNVP